MFPGERELRRIVIEDRARPLRRRMARFASLREASRRVVWIGRLLEVRQMARRTSSAESGVFPADVAGGAGNRRVFAGQWEFRGVVVERGSGPLRGGVARFARGREAGMARVLGRLILWQMASRTSCS